MQYQQQRSDAALSTARKCFTSHFDGASHMFVGGSIMRGEGNDFSDIDLVVVYPKLPRAWRQSFRLDGFPIEAFVHDPETLIYFFESDVKSGAPVIVHMVANGTIVSTQMQEAENLQRRARSILAQGPGPLTGERYDTMRYFLSDLVDDLRAPKATDEIAAVSALLYPRLIDLMLLGRNQWTGKGKWGPRLLRGFDPALADLAAKAFAEAVLGRKTALLLLAEQELDRHGGSYFDGYRVDAAPDARIVVGNAAT